MLYALFFKAKLALFVMKYKEISFQVHQRGKRMNLEIKKCRETDIAAVAEFYDEQVRHMDMTDTNYPLWEYNVYPSITSVRECTERAEQYFCVLDGEICGAFVLNENPGGAYEKGKWKRQLSLGEYLVIHTLSVDYKRSGRGIGKRIVEFCLDTARSGGYKAVRIDVVPINIPAIRLYEKMGFSFAGEMDLDRAIKEIPSFSLFEYNF